MTTRSPPPVRPRMRGLPGKPKRHSSYTTSGDAAGAGAGQHAVLVPSAARDGPKAHKAGCCGLTLRVSRIETTSFNGFMTLQHKKAVNCGF